MKFIRAVLGDLPADQLGVCDSHTHVILESDRFPEFHHDSVTKAVEELVRFKSDGGGAMIDAMPGGCGRNGEKLAEVSRQTGVHLVASTGMHLAKYYDSSDWRMTCSEEALVNVWMVEIQQGMDRTIYRAGVIKIASGNDCLSDHEKKIFRVAAEVHRRTGAPILTHTEQGMAGVEQVEFLRVCGVNLKKVLLSHLDRNPDSAYHREILSSGVGLEYDSGFRWKEGNATADLVLKLSEEFPNQLMLGTDAGRPTYWKSYGGSPGMSFLLKEFRALLLKRGLKESIWNQIMIQNPASFYAFDM